MNGPEQLIMHESKCLFTPNVTMTVSKCPSKFNIISLVTNTLTSKMGFSFILSIKMSFTKKNKGIADKMDDIDGTRK